MPPPAFPAVAEFVRIPCRCAGATEFSRIQPPRFSRPCVFALLLFALFFASRAAAADSDTAVKSGGDALRSDNRFPWYDSAHDDLRPVGLRQVKDDGKQKSRGKNVAPSRRWRNSNDSGSSDDDSPAGDDAPQDDSAPPSSPAMPEVSAPWLIWIAWLVIGGVLMFLAAMLIRALLNREARRAKSSDGESIASEDDRLDALPLSAAPRRKRTLLDEARRSYEAGDYAAAIVYLYAHQLLKLDQNQWIRLAKGKTNREYLRELAGRGELQAVLARTMVPFEDVYFGNHPLDRARFEACWNEVERFDRLVARTPS